MGYTRTIPIKYLPIDCMLEWYINKVQLSVGSWLLLDVSNAQPDDKGTYLAQLNFDLIYKIDWKP